MLPHRGANEETKYEEDLAFELFIKYCGKNMLARQLLIAPQQRRVLKRLREM